ncbi:MAG: Pr6Pr family membrane protein [Microbacteriaceae bacterium]|nr:Pr6Pr family membrane protein [Microbacteriaceae bacterium]
MIALARWAVAALILVAVGATLAEAVERTGGINPFNFFGYFTIQSNLLLALVLVLSGTGLGRWSVGLPYARGAVTVYIVIVGVVYGTLLAPLAEAGGVPVPWANTILHNVSPVLAALDWLVVGDRPRLRWSRLWVLLPYPAVWVAVVLARGATDGWVPYPFLAPSQGYGVVAAYCGAIFVLALAFGAIAWLVTRWRGLIRRSQRIAS